uniref:Uncharacterized protein n=1 Tax=Panagrellus redivivus TaxID=6233 RepID=A0A7E4ZS70_PANRE
MLVIALNLCSKRKPETGSKQIVNPPPPETTPSSTRNASLNPTSKKESTPAVTPQSKSQLEKPLSAGVPVPTAIGSEPVTPTAAGTTNGSGGDKKKDLQKSDAGTNGVGASVQKTTKDGATGQSTAGNVSNNGSVVPGQDGVDQEGKPKVEKTVMLTLRQKKGEESDAGENDGGEAIDAGHGKDGTEKKKK